MPIKALIRWHYYDRDGRIINVLTTMFRGTAEEFYVLLQEECQENKRRKKITIVPQIIVFPSL